MGDDKRRLCPEYSLSLFVDNVKAQLLRQNVLMTGNALLVASMVVLGATGWRFRHSAVTRFVSLGATTLFLPIVSYVVSSIGYQYCKSEGMNIECVDRAYVYLLLMWTALVQIVGINFSAIVAVNDGDSKNLGPSTELLARTLWTSYLVLYYNNRAYVSSGGNIFVNKSYQEKLSVHLIALCVLSFLKIALKFCAFEMAKRSVALGRNSHLVAGYMEHLHSQQPEGEPIPPLIVMGEEKQQIEERPHGYIINQAKTNNSFVTIDRVWLLASTGDVLLAGRPQLKHLCLSFALFKLLRRRFGRCQLAESGSIKAFSFVRDVLLSDGDPDRVFRVVADEVSFLGDSYYSSLPTCSFGKLLPFLNTILSLTIVAFCLSSGVTIEEYFFDDRSYQILCFSWSCKVNQDDYITFGSLNFNYYSTYFLLVAAVVAEAWEVASYICSNWFKVTLICSYVTHASWQQSPCIHRWLGLLLKFRIKWIKGYSDNMSQISLLAHRQPNTCGLRQKLFCFSDHHRVQHIKVPREVKAAIVQALTRSNGSLSNGVVALQNSGIGTTLLWATQQAESTTDMILIWHIATGIFEASTSSHTASTTSSSSGSSDRTVATCISQYCVYLLKAAPELLPDDKAWSKKRYKAVSEEICHLLSAPSGKSVDHDRLIDLLSRSSDRHEVVKNGVRLGKQLAEQHEDAEMVWGVLARFWSEMILYVAPSDNLEAHKETIARGGEMLTLIWVLLNNAGIITRPGIRTAAAA